MRARAAVRLLIVFAVYVASARAGLALDAVSGFATVVWAPTGISLAAMLAWGFGVWPAVALGAAVVNVFVGAPLLVALGIAAGNTAEALAGAWMLRVVRFDPRLQRLSDVFGLILLGAVGSALISATVGVLGLRLGGVVPAEISGRAWRNWWIGDLMGALVVTPPILVWWTRPPIRKRPHLIAEATLAVLAVAATVALVFGTRRPIFELRVPGYVLFPVLLVVSTRFGQYGAATANLAVTVAAISFTALGYGPFVRAAGLSENLLQLQMLMGILAVTTLVLGAAVPYDEQCRSAGSSISISCEGDCRGFWDRDRLEQVVDNLFSNAVKYGDGKAIDVTVRGTSSSVVLSVSDHGIGIASDDQRRLFNRFERGESGRRYAGLGLGLWIVRQIVDAHRGRIDVQSTPGDGTTFVVELQQEALERRSGPAAGRPSESNDGEVISRRVR